MSHIPKIRPTLVGDSEIYRNQNHKMQNLFWRKYLDTLIRNCKIDIGNQNYFLEVLAKMFLMTFLNTLKTKGRIATRQVIW